MGYVPKLFDCEKFKEITLMHLTILSINVRLAGILVFFENSLFDRPKLGVMYRELPWRKDSN